ncbi:hypothetical protein BC832DRAFT_588408 [Gaertneriomyces semiglobifer]|nr:hypothetical protein BC832DRAFT_588408 [Gaertneriomyces semiglobifer]
MSFGRPVLTPLPPIPSALSLLYLVDNDTTPNIMSTLRQFLVPGEVGVCLYYSKEKAADAAAQGLIDGEFSDGAWGVELEGPLEEAVCQHLQSFDTILPSSTCFHFISAKEDLSFIPTHLGRPVTVHTPHSPAPNAFVHLPAHILKSIDGALKERVNAGFKPLCQQLWQETQCKADIQFSADRFYEKEGEHGLLVMCGGLQFSDGMWTVRRDVIARILGYSGDSKSSLGGGTRGSVHGTVRKRVPEDEPPAKRLKRDTSADGLSKNVPLVKDSSLNEIRRISSASEMTTLKCDDVKVKDEEGMRVKEDMRVKDERDMTTNDDEDREVKEDEGSEEDWQDDSLMEDGELESSEEPETQFLPSGQDASNLHFQQPWAASNEFITPLPLETPLIQSPPQPSLTMNITYEPTNEMPYLFTLRRLLESSLPESKITWNLKTYPGPLYTAVMEVSKPHQVFESSGLVPFEKAAVEKTARLALSFYNYYHEACMQTGHFSGRLDMPFMTVQDRSSDETPGGSQPLNLAPTLTAVLPQPQRTTYPCLTQLHQYAQLKHCQPDFTFEVQGQTHAATVTMLGYTAKSLGFFGKKVEAKESAAGVWLKLANGVTAPELVNMPALTVQAKQASPDTLAVVADNPSMLLPQHFQKLKCDPVIFDMERIDDTKFRCLITLPNLWRTTGSETPTIMRFTGPVATNKKTAKRLASEVAWNFIQSLPEKDRGGIRTQSVEWTASLEHSPSDSKEEGELEEGEIAD